MLLADGILYVVDGTMGDLCMVKPDPTGYREIARANYLRIAHEIISRFQGDDAAGIAV